MRVKVCVVLDVAPAINVVVEASSAAIYRSELADNMNCGEKALEFHCVATHEHYVIPTQLIRYVNVLGVAE